jgi:hypothetical protein
MYTRYQQQSLCLHSSIFYFATQHGPIGFSNQKGRREPAALESLIKMAA